LYHLIFFSHDV